MSAPSSLRLPKTRSGPEIAIGSCPTIDSRVVDVVMGAQFLCEFRCLGTATYRNHFESHVPRVLNAEMTEAGNAEHRDQIAGLRRGVTQSAESRESGAEQRCGIYR